jgi:hypothetical protein
VTDTGKRRKVLDDIALRHVMLTEHPSYRQSFAEAVAKTFTGEAPADDAFVEPVDLAAEQAEAAAIVAKAAPPKPKASDDEPDGDEKPDAPPAAAADAGPGADGDTTATPSPAGDEDADKDGEISDAEAAKGLPMATRHLSCPQCGHEFAADLPTEDVPSDTHRPDQDSDGDSAAKSHTEQETTVAKTEAEILTSIRALVEAAPATVEKTAAPEPVVEKTATEGGDVLKMLAASHQHAEDRIDGIEASLREDLGAVTKAIQGLGQLIAELPQGRKSVARVLPTRDELDEDVSKSVNTDPEKADTPQDAMKALNASRGVL